MSARFPLSEVCRAVEISRGKVAMWQSRGLLPTYGREGLTEHEAFRFVLLSELMDFGLDGDRAARVARVAAPILRGDRLSYLVAMTSPNFNTDGAGSIQVIPHDRLAATITAPGVRASLVLNIDFVAYRVEAAFAKLRAKA